MPSRTGALLRTFSLAAFVAGLWYLTGAAMAHAAEQVQPARASIAGAVGDRAAADRAFADRAFADRAFANGAVPDRSRPDGYLRAAVSGGWFRIMSADSRESWMQRASRAASRGDVPPSPPAVAGADHAVRHGVDAVIGTLPVYDTPAGDLLDDVRAPIDRQVGGGATTPWVPSAGGVAPATGDRPAAPAATGTGAPPVLSAACPHAVNTGPAGVRTRPRMAVLSTASADAGSTARAGKAPCLSAVAVASAVSPPLVCTVYERSGPVPALRLRASEPPVSPD
jgi:hypothetical protein